MTLVQIRCITLLLTYVCISPLIQADKYRMYFEKAIVLSYDTEYICQNITTYKYNRTMTALNITTIVYKEFPPNVMMKAKTYEFLNNEYRPFAIETAATYCNYLSREFKMFFYPGMNTFGSNPIPPRCPVVPGTYNVYKYVLLSQHFPVTLPFKKCMLELTTFLGDRVLMKEQFYAILDRDILYREQYG